MHTRNKVTSCRKELEIKDKILEVKTKLEEKANGINTTNYTLWYVSGKSLKEKELKEEFCKFESKWQILKTDQEIPKY